MDQHYATPHQSTALLTQQRILLYRVGITVRQVGPLTTIKRNAQKFHFAPKDNGVNMVKKQRVHLENLHRRLVPPRVTCVILENTLILQVESTVQSAQRGCNAHAGPSIPSNVGVKQIEHKK